MVVFIRENLHSALNWMWSWSLAWSNTPTHLQYLLGGEESRTPGEAQSRTFRSDNNPIYHDVFLTCFWFFDAFSQSIALIDWVLFKICGFLERIPISVVFTACWRVLTNCCVDVELASVRRAQISYCCHVSFVFFKRTTRWMYISVMSFFFFLLFFLMIE